MTERALPVTILEPAGIDPELLDHSLSLRFDLGQFDPRITFTRNSSATYFGSDGLLKTASANEPRIDYDPVTGECKGFLVEETRTNLHLYSENFSAGWSSLGEVSLVGAAALSPDGTQTAGSFLCNTTNNVIRRLYASANISVTQNTTYTASAYIKAVNWGWVGIGLASGTGYTTNAVLARVNLSTGQTTLQLGTSVALSDVGNGWYRVAVTGTTPETMTSARFSFVLLDADESIVNTAIGVVGAGIYVWGAQLEVGSFPTSYIPTPATFTSRNSTGTYFDSTGVMRTAAINEARYDHALVDGKWVSKGLMLEGSRTNLFPRSEELSAWSMNPSPNDAIILPNATVAPDGTTTADKHVPTATLGGHGVYRTFTGGINKVYTASVFVKAAEYGYASIGFGNAGFNYVNPNAIFDLSTGALVFTRGAPLQASATKLKDGWWRISISAMSGSSGGPYVAITSTLAAPNMGSFAGDGVSGAYIWGMQVEEIPAGESLLPSSYIKTEGTTVTRAADLSTSSQVTRAADSAVMTGTNFSSWYRQDEGTLFADFIPNKSGAIIYTDDGSMSNRIQIGISSANTGQTSVVKSGVVEADIFSVVSTPLYAANKIAFSFGGNTASQSTNGAASITDGNAIIPAVSRLRIGLNAAGAHTASANIRRLSFYPRRLTNAQLQALTQ